MVEVGILNNSNIYLKPNTGGVDLYYGKTDKKFETTGYGATVFGTTQTQQLNVSGVATATAILEQKDLQLELPLIRLVVLQRCLSTQQGLVITLEH